MLTSSSSSSSRKMVSPVFYDDGCGLRGDAAVQTGQEDCSAGSVGGVMVFGVDGFSGTAGSEFTDGSVGLAVGMAMSVDSAVTSGGSWMVSCRGDFCMEQTSRARAR